MKYCDFIKINNNFQYSINLHFDSNKLEKIESYIPTNKAMELLNYYLKSIYYETKNKERATVLIGPYGKGKSHLLLILLSIISINSEDENKNNVLNNLFRKIANINKDTYELISEIRKDNKKILPIIVNSNSIDLKQSFLIALREALENENLIDLIPNTYFDAVLNTIYNWEDKYKDTYDKFKSKIDDYDISIKDFINRIKKYDEEMYLLFRDIYEDVTSGGTFNPLIGNNIIKLYEEVNLKLCNEKNYKGMFVVFDEFSKFLEGSVGRNSSNDMEILQSFAELADRSGRNQLHICCVTHKPINDYILNLPKEKIDSWRAVEGRFSQLYFTSSSSHNYDLISSALIKDEEIFDNYFKTNKEEFLGLINSCGRLGLFQDIENYEELVCKKCYPLNPISTYLLPRISEKVAQNERTLFTFLAKDERGSLARFIKEEAEGFKCLTVDYIFDYFEVLFKKEVFNENVHSIWFKGSSVLKKIKDKIERKIIKAISLIYIANELDKLSPTDLFIQASLNLTREEYMKAINSLINKHILLKKKSNGYYGFLPGSNINISNVINNAKESKVKNVNYKEILEEIIDLGYELPKRHNDKYEMIRFFKKTFITFKELESFNNTEEIFNFYKSDGIIFYLIYENDEERKKAIAKQGTLKSKRILICIPNKSFTKLDDLKGYRAIQHLKNDTEFIKSDEYIMQELEIHESDLIDDIKEYIKNNYEIKYRGCKYYYLGLEATSIKRSSDISKFISDLCDLFFDSTLTINNEMINKMKISSPILKARNRVIEYIFEEMNTENDEGLLGNGPEATIYRATLENKGLTNATKRANDVNAIISKIELFVLSCEEIKKSFSVIYTKLGGEKFGLRAGVIPIYLSFVLKDFKSDVVIYYIDKGKEKEIPLSVDTINKINLEPEKYYLYIEKGTNEKRDYIKKLYDLFSNHKGNKKIGYNMFNSIAEAMQKWVQSLPKYTREFESVLVKNEIKELDNEIKSIRKSLLRIEINPRQFLFDEIKEILNEENYEIILSRIISIKEELDKHISNLKNVLIERSIEIFDEKHKGALATLLYEWHSNLSEFTKKHLYDASTNEFLNFISSNKNYDDIFIIERLGKIITGLSIEDWNDTTLYHYENKLKEIKDEIESYKEEMAKDVDEYYEIKFYENGKEKNRNFKLEEISSVGKALFNEIEEMLEEYGDSVEENEKRNILIKLMNKLM